MSRIVSGSLTLTVALLVIACGGGQRAASDAGALAPADPFASTSSAPSDGQLLAFGLRDGAIRNYFVRQGPVAAHLLARSGPHPRVIAAFPANNQGIGVWFAPAPASSELSAGAAPESEPLASGGELMPVLFQRAERDAHGVRATLKSTATELSTELVLLGNVRTLRDYGYGSCLEDATRFPALRNETIEPGPSKNTLRIRREQIGGDASMELWLAGRSGTTLALRERTAPAREACPLPNGQGQPVIDIVNPGGIELELIALADDAPLTPIEPDELFAMPPSAAGASSGAGAATPGDATPLELSAHAFLSYDEKLLAGSWRFLTYFGRDTLLSLWLLMPALDSRVVEAAIGAVLERVELEPGVAAPEGGSIALGDVAHEEELGDYAAWKNSELDPPPANLRQPRYDYKMIDDDFLLAPLLLALARQLDADDLARSTPTAASPLPTDPQPAFDDFLARRRSDGNTFRDAALANLELVLGRARPFADDARPLAQKRSLLVALHDNLSVGQWRDSEMGLAFGRYPFDVNAALVPAALDAAASLYERLARPDAASDARRLRAAWSGIEESFRIDIPLDRARANVASYAASLGLTDTSSSLAADAAPSAAPPSSPSAPPISVQYAIALDRSQRPLPIVHSDHGFVLAFTDPSDAYLERVAALLTRPFPAGLASPVGVLVANPGFADPDAVVDPGSRTEPSSTSPPLRALFTPSHYHGAVVWSWQQALLAKGLRRQLERSDLAPSTLASLAAAECALWGMIDATRGGSTRELWSWAPGADGRPELRPFGASPSEGSELTPGASDAGVPATLPDADESNAIQLWSTVYLAVHAPTPAQNSRCEPAGVSP
ncbi:MAG TPA: hypothetical protein VMG12_25965 [Polyangiaceae bacterium]|nr:hypothetical protein [Polyangiaceae bacterium]